MKGVRLPETEEEWAVVKTMCVVCEDQHLLKPGNEQAPAGTVAQELYTALRELADTTEKWWHFRKKTEGTCRGGLGCCLCIVIVC